MKFRAGDLVEVRSVDEILRTLDKGGCMEGLPFSPQMFGYCGQRFRVYKRAHKTCDTIAGTGGRHLEGGIHLDLRCDGKAYGGCQAGCLLFWKEAWLKPVPAGDSAEGSEPIPATQPANITPICSEQDVINATRVPGDPTRHRCQATELLRYTTLLPWWDFSQYVEDYRSGNASLGRMVSGFIYVCYNTGTQAWRDKIGMPARWLYDAFQSLRGGAPYPWRKGRRAIDGPAPKSDLSLQPGELVRVKSYPEILDTLDTKTNHRGLKWDAELVPYCGKTYRVKTRIDQFIDERTGKMTTLKTPAVVLEGVWCQARYSECRMFCPRSIYSWWREIWLERVEDPKVAGHPQDNNTKERTPNAA